MACNTWEERWLLYGSDELSEQEVADFTSHIKNCDACRCELDTYNLEKKSFYTFDILGENTSEAVDREILRVCSSRRRQVATFNLFPIFFKKAAISVALFLIGFSAVGYIAFKVESKRTTFTPVVAQKNLQQSSPMVAEPTTAKDSAEESVLSDSAVNFAKTRGNLDLRGVYPVDLQNR